MEEPKDLDQLPSSEDILLDESPPVSAIIIPQESMDPIQVEEKKQDIIVEDAKEEPPMSEEEAPIIEADPPVPSEPSPPDEPETIVAAEGSIQIFLKKCL
jgi:hypothetical protein